MRSTASLAIASCAAFAFCLVTLDAQRGHGAPPVKVKVAPAHVIKAKAPHVAQGHGPKTLPPGQAKVKPSHVSGAPKPASIKVQQHLIQQPKLAAKLQALLPAGTDVQAAATGFRTLGQFVAAVHVSRNLNIPFAVLRARMTGPNPMSLGQAIHSLSPNVNTSAEVRRAELEARTDLRSSREK